MKLIKSSSLILAACFLSTALSVPLAKDSKMPKDMSQNPDRIRTVWEESLGLEISGNHEFVEIRFENLTSRPLRYLTFGDGTKTDLLPFGLLLKARDAENRLLVTDDLDYWRGYWSPGPYPKDLSGLSSWELGPHSERKHRIEVNELISRAPFRGEIEDFKIMLCVFRTHKLEDYFGDGESPWIHYRPKTSYKSVFKSG